MDKISISNTLEQINTSRTTLYRYIKKAGIKPIKIRGVSHLSQKDFIKLKQDITGEKTHDDDIKEKQGDTNYEQLNTNTKQTDTNQQVKELKESLKEEQEAHKRTIQELGQWQGRAKTLEEQNIKLLESQSTTIEISEKTGIFAKISQWWKK